MEFPNENEMAQSNPIDTPFDGRSLETLMTQVDLSKDIVKGPAVTRHVNGENWNSKGPGFLRYYQIPLDTARNVDRLTWKNDLEFPSGEKVRSTIDRWTFKNGHGDDRKEVNGASFIAKSGEHQPRKIKIWWQDFKEDKHYQSISADTHWTRGPNNGEHVEFFIHLPRVTKTGINGRKVEYLEFEFTSEFGEEMTMPDIRIFGLEGSKQSPELR